MPRLAKGLVSARNTVILTHIPSGAPAGWSPRLCSPQSHAPQHGAFHSARVGVGRVPRGMAQVASPARRRLSEGAGACGHRAVRALHVRQAVASGPSTGRAGTVVHIASSALKKICWCRNWLPCPFRKFEKRGGVRSNVLFHQHCRGLLPLCPGYRSVLPPAQSCHLHRNPPVSWQGGQRGQHARSPRKLLLPPFGSFHSLP